MERYLFFTLIFSILFLFACGGDDLPKSNDPLDFPDSCDNYRFEITSGTINFSSQAPNFISADAQNQNGFENFFFKATPLDSNFNVTNEELQSLSFSFFDADGDLIMESSSIPPSYGDVYELWDVNLINEPYYGEFTYTIDLTYPSGDISGEGKGFAVSCALIEKSCEENNSDAAMFLDSDNCLWGSNIRLQNLPAQSDFAVNCCQ